MSVQVEGYRNESFESLEAAVMETPRGRWFLEEYARRQRSKETLAILEILRKLENTITHPATAAAPALKNEHMKFFKEDEDLFVAPPNKPAEAAARPENTAPAESRGARLKIRHVATETVPESATPAAADFPPDSMNVHPDIFRAEPAAEAADDEPKPRVIIIRKAASEAMEIPMVDEPRSESAA
jgi:hypothetical protein